MNGLVDHEYLNWECSTNNRNTKTRCEICSKLTIKTSELSTYFISSSSVFIVNFEQVNGGLGPGN